MVSPAVLSKLTHCKNPYDIDGLTWEEICWAKARMARDVSLYADAKYQQTDEEKTKTVEAITRLLKQLVIMPKSGHGTAIAWDYELTVDKAHKLCDIAIHEDMYSNICPACHGKGEGHIGPRHVVCDTCNGTRRLQFTPERIAWVLMVNRATYYRRYAEPYAKIMQILAKWDEQVYRAVAQLRRESQQCDSADTQ